MTSFVLTPFGDAIAEGMAVTGTLNDNGTYSFAYQNDQIGACNNTISCTHQGNYSHSGSTITIDPGTADATTFNYVIAGLTMTWTGTIDGTRVRITMVKV